MPPPVTFPACQPASPCSECSARTHRGKVDASSHHTSIFSLPSSIVKGYARVFAIHSPVEEGQIHRRPLQRASCCPAGSIRRWPSRRHNKCACAGGPPPTTHSVRSTVSPLTTLLLPRSLQQGIILFPGGPHGASFQPSGTYHFSFSHKSRRPTTKLGSYALSHSL